uniref:DNA topoisomerase n=1 Tax=Panagrolaimus superbus TaxID=310955 RepID=A0A914YZY3_9BILA
MAAQHILDLVYKCFTRHQKRILRAKFPDLNIDDLPFGPCQTVALAIAVEKFKIKQNHIPKFCVEASVDVNDEAITLINSQQFDDRKSAEELCQKLKSFECCKVISEPVSIKQSHESMPGLNTFELLIYMSKYHGLNSSDVVIAAQRLYNKGFITYPRTESIKYPESARNLSF